MMLKIKNLKIIEYTQQDSNPDGLFAVLRSNHHTTIASAKHELFADYIKIHIIRVSQCDYNIIEHAYSSHQCVTLTMFHNPDIHWEIFKIMYLIIPGRFPELI